jgi:hypothetical protein
MAVETQTSESLTKILRWSARIVGLIATGLFLLFLIESGPNVIPELSWTNPRGIPLLLAMGVAVAGVLAGWFLELVGGVMTLIGAVAIPVLVFLGSGGVLLIATLILIVPLLVPGILFLACYWRSRPRPPSEKVVIAETYQGNGASLPAKSR